MLEPARVTCFRPTRRLGGVSERVSCGPADSGPARVLRQAQPIYPVFEVAPAVAVRRILEGLRATAVLPGCATRKPLGSLHPPVHAEIPAQTRVVIEAIAAQADRRHRRIRAETEQRRLERQILEISDCEQSDRPGNS